MRTYATLALAFVLLPVTAVQAHADEGQHVTTDRAMCTLDLGTVTVGPISQRLPAVTYPCP